MTPAAARLGPVTVLTSELSPCLRPQNAWINNFAQSAEYTEFDWPGGSRVIKRWWRTTLRVIAPWAAPIYLLSTVCWTIFLSVLQNKVVSRPAPDQPLRTAGERSPWRRVEGQISAENEELRGVVTGAGDSQTKDTNLLIVILFHVMSQFQNSCNAWRSFIISK